jgi:hypothetical protein
MITPSSGRKPTLPATSSWVRSIWVVQNQFHAAPLDLRDQFIEFG